MAERMADRHIPMTMEDWSKRIDIILEAGGDAILNDAGKIIPGRRACRSDQKISLQNTFSPICHRTSPVVLDAEKVNLQVVRNSSQYAT